MEVFDQLLQPAVADDGEKEDTEGAEDADASKPGGRSNVVTAASGFMTARARVTSRSMWTDEGRLLANLRDAAERSVEGLETGARLSAVERTAASAVSAMSEEKAREALAAMAPGDVAAITRAMSPGDMRGKADVIARTLLDMSEEDADSVLAATIGSMGDGDDKSDATGVGAVLEKMPPAKTARALFGCSAEKQAKVLGAMSGDAAAAALEAMPEEARLAALGAMNDAAIRNLTAGLGAGLSQSPLSASLIGPITLTVYSYTLRETDTFFLSYQKRH